jgi:hypothetical protein
MIDKYTAPAPLVEEDERISNPSLAPAPAPNAVIVETIITEEEEEEQEGGEESALDEQAQGPTKRRGSGTGNMQQVTSSATLLPLV